MLVKILENKEVMDYYFLIKVFFLKNREEIHEGCLQ